MNVTIIFLLIFCFGYFLSSIVIKNLPFFEKIGVSYLLGMGLTTLLIFFTSWAGMRITSENILIVLLIQLGVVVGLAAVFKRKPSFSIPNFPKRFLKLKPYQKAISLLVVIIFGLSFIISTYFPVYIWDALALYDFTARIITQTGYFVQVAHNYFYFAQYPLLVPLGHTIVYLFGGSNPQFIYSFYFVALTLIFFSLIRNASSKVVAFVAILFLVTNPQMFAHSTFSYTNLPYTVFYATGVIYLFKAITRTRNDYLIMSSLLIGLSTWARSAEPIWLSAALILMIYSAVKRNIKPLLLFFIPFFIIQHPWSQFQASFYGVAVSTGGQLSLIPSLLANGLDFGRIVDISLYIYKNIIQSWGPIVAIFIISIFFDITNRITKTNLVMLMIILVNFVALYAGTYLFSLRFDEWKDIPGSAIRLAMFFPPLMIYYICLVIGKYSKKQLKSV